MGECVRRRVSYGRGILRKDYEENVLSPQLRRSLRDPTGGRQLRRPIPVPDLVGKTTSFRGFFDRRLYDFERLEDPRKTQLNLYSRGEGNDHIRNSLIDNHTRQAKVAREAPITAPYQP